MMELTQESMNAFKESCQKWARIWGLMEWTFYFGWQEKDGTYASTACDGNVATIKLTHQLDDDDWQDFDVDRLACHEIAHVAIGKLAHLALSRCVSTTELDDTIEETATRIENVAMDLYKERYDKKADGTS